MGPASKMSINIHFLTLYRHCSCSVIKSYPTLLSYGVQHARPLYPSLSRGVHLDSCPLSQWCQATISSSAIPFSSCPQFFPASRSFPMIQLLTSGGQSIGASASASVLPVNIQGWFPLGLTSLISLQFKGLSRVLQHHNLKASILWHSDFLMVQLPHLYMTTGKP